MKFSLMNCLPVLTNLHRPAGTICDTTLAVKTVTVLLQKWTLCYLNECSMFDIYTYYKFGYDGGGTMCDSKTLILHFMETI